MPRRWLMFTFVRATSKPASYRTARWAVLLLAGQSLSSHASSTVPDGLQTGREPHQHLVGSREKSPPPDTWTESGQTPILWQSSSSRESAPA